MPPQENLIIERLSPATRERLLALCEPFELKLSTPLSERGQALSHAHFPRHGFISLVIDVDHYPALEVGMVGREGLLGSELILGSAKAPWRALVQGAGESWRIEAQALREVSATHRDLEHLLQGSLLVRLHQQALASACERFHLIGARLARWLLMSQDRAQSPQFHVTQEFIALMLGVRRVSVTVAASELQRQGLISYHRGDINVLDRTRLKAQACSCYAADTRLMRGMLAGYVRSGTDGEH